MFEGKWVILKCSMQISLGQMPGVSCLGEQTEISQFQFGNLLAHQIQSVCPHGTTNAGIHYRQYQQQQQQPRVEEEKRGLAHDG